MSEVATVVSWYGPYPDVKVARLSAYHYYYDGLYAAFGYEFLPCIGRTKFLYVGVGAPLYTRLTRDHHKLSQAARLTSIWLGVIESQKRAGPRIKKIEPLLDAVEWAMVAFLKPAMNARKVKWPKDPVIVRNRWYSIEDDSHFEEPVAIWPDVIDFAGSFAPAYLVWLKSQRTVAIRNPRMFLETTQ